MKLTKAQRSRGYYSHAFLTEALFEFKRVQAAPGPLGICEELVVLRNLYKGGKLIKQLFKLWPSHSGDPWYPVPAPKGWSPPLVRYYGTRARAAFYCYSDRWGEHPYGDSRRALLAFMIQEVEAMLSHIERHYQDEGDDDE